jgi:hypothetical protein
MRHSRYFLIFILFIALYFAADRVGGLLLQDLTLRSGIRFSRLYSGKFNAEILVLGDSRGVNCIYAPLAEKMTGRSCANISYNGMGVAVAEILFRDYLAHNAPPKLLVLEVTNLTVGAALIYNLKPYQSLSSGLGKLLLAENRSIYYACQLTHLYRFNCELFLRALYYLGRDDQSWINRYVIQPEFAKSYQPSPAFVRGIQETIPPDSVRAFRKILAQAEESGAEVRLLVSPFLPSHISRLHDLYDKRKTGIENLAGGLHVWDYADALDDIRCFADPLHMNIEGARLVLRQMVADGFFAIPTSE